MTPTRLQQIKEYITELFEALYEWDLDYTAQEVELSSLQQVIEELKEETLSNPNHPQIEVMAKLGIDSVMCLECIKRRLGMEN